MTGILYAIGVGPGDPELMTLKAVRRMEQCQVVAIPHTDPDKCVSYKIALQAVPEITKKALLCVDIPMTKEKEVLERSHRDGAEKIAEVLQKGQDVALLTLGDSTVYASSMYLVRHVKRMGYPVEIINGIPSFCAAAAAMEISLGEKSEEIHILPGSYQIEESLRLPGVKILMKMGKQFPKVCDLLRKGDYEVYMIENCGMEDERIYYGVEALPEKAGYYSLMVVRDISGKER